MTAPRVDSTQKEEAQTCHFAEFGAASHRSCRTMAAAVDWTAQHYLVEENPGQDSAEHFSYYRTFAAAPNAAKVEELVDKLVQRQQPDGSWANENRQWFENDKNLATAFALIALSYCDSAAK